MVGCGSNFLDKLLLMTYVDHPVSRDSALELRADVRLSGVDISLLLHDTGRDFERVGPAAITRLTFSGIALLYWLEPGGLLDSFLAGETVKARASKDGQSGYIMADV